MYFSLKIFAKNKKSLKEFLDFLSKVRSPAITFCNFPERKKKNFLTVLKSPHINKTAQDQFEYKIFCKTLHIWSPQYKFLLIFLKKIIKTSFPGIKMQVNSLVSFTFEKKTVTDSLNPKVINLFFFQNSVNKKSRKQKTFKYVNLFDCFGELTLFFKSMT